MKSFNVMFLTELSGVAKSGCKLSAVSAAATQSRLLNPSAVITADGVQYFHLIGLYMTAQSVCPTCFAALPYMLCASCLMHGAAIVPIAC
jgi:hypothetical protein